MRDLPRLLRRRRERDVARHRDDAAFHAEAGCFELASDNERAWPRSARESCAGPSGSSSRSARTTPPHPRSSTRATPAGAVVAAVSAAPRRRRSRQMLAVKRQPLVAPRFEHHLHVLAEERVAHRRATHRSCGIPWRRSRDRRRSSRGRPTTRRAARSLRRAGAGDKTARAKQPCRCAAVPFAPQCARPSCESTDTRCTC